MSKMNSFLDKVIKLISFLGKMSALLLTAHIILASALGATFAFDIFIKKISTEYPFFILIFDVVPIFFFKDNDFKIFIAFSLILIFLAVVKFFVAEGNLLELFKTKNILKGEYGFLHIFPITFTLETIYTMIITLLGITPYVPSLPHPVIVTVVAPVEEEIAARLVWIGIPLIILNLVKRRDIREIPQKIILGWREINKTSIVLTLISAVIFAQAHVKYGWDIWKFPAAFIAGIGLGIVFVKYGFLSSILFHFAWNSLAYIPLANMVLGLPYFIVGLFFLAALIFKVYKGEERKESENNYFLTKH